MPTPLLTVKSTFRLFALFVVATQLGSGTNHFEMRLTQKWNDHAQRLSAIAQCLHKLQSQPKHRWLDHCASQIGVVESDHSSGHSWSQSTLVCCQLAELHRCWLARATLVCSVPEVAALNELPHSAVLGHHGHHQCTGFEPTWWRCMRWTATRIVLTTVLMISVVPITAMVVYFIVQYLRWKCASKSDDSGSGERRLRRHRRDRLRSMERAEKAFRTKEKPQVRQKQLHTQKLPLETILEMDEDIDITAHRPQSSSKPSVSKV